MLTTQQALDLFLTREVAARNYTASTRRTYAHDLGEFLRSLPDDTPADCLTLAQVKQYLAVLDPRGLSSATKHRKLAALKTFIRFLEEDEPPLLHVPFSAKIPLPHVERREPRYLSKVEYQAVLREASSHPRDAAMLEVFLQTGIRLSELVGLTLDDVELPEQPKRSTGEGARAWGGTIRVQCKRRKVQYLPLNARACQRFQAYLKARPATNEIHVFLTKYRTPITSRSVQKVFKTYAMAAGVAWAHPHPLRTTFITHHIASGSPITDIKEMVGHENLATTNVYAGLVKSSQRKPMQEHAL
jgi:site-specific recombinase XerD